MLMEVKDKQKDTAIRKGIMINILIHIIRVAENRGLLGIVPASFSVTEPVLPW